MATQPSSRLFPRAVFTQAVADVPTGTPVAHDALEPSVHFDFPQTGLMRSLVSSGLPELPPAVNSISAAAAAASEAAQSITGLIDIIRGFLTSVPTLSDYVTKICDALAIFYDCVIAFLQQLYCMIPTLIYRLLSLFNLPQSLMTLVVLKMSCVFAPPELNQGPREESVQGAQDIVSNLTATIGMLLLGREPNQQELKHVIEKLRFSQLMRGEMKATQELIMNFVRSLPDVVKNWLQYVMPSKWWLATFEPGSEFYTWMCAVEALEGHEIKVRAAYDLELQQQIRELHKQGQDLMKKVITAGPEIGRVQTLLRSKAKTIDDLFAIVDVSAIHQTNRPVPFCVYLEGAAGKGKTFLATILPSILAGADPSTPNLSYTRNPGVAHWDGYTGQFAVCYDDFYATRNQNVSPGEMAEFIAIVSNEQYRLPMANLDDKGEVFRSRCLVMTSNVAYPNANELVTPEALYRRRHAMYRIDIDPRFCKPGTSEVDPTRIPADNSHYRIQRYETPGSNANVTLTPVMSYGEFIIDVVDRYVNHIASEQNSIQAGRNMIREAHNMPEVQQIRTRLQNLALARIGPQEEQAQGVLSDVAQVVAIGSLLAGSQHAFAEAKRAHTRWYDEVCVIFGREVQPKWVEVVLQICGFASAMLGVIWGVMLMVKKWHEAQQLHSLRTKVKDAYQLTEGKPESEGRKQTRQALKAFAREVSQDDLDRILDKYYPEGRLLLKEERRQVPESAYNIGRALVKPKIHVIRSNFTEGDYQPRKEPLHHVAEGCTDQNALDIVTHRISYSKVNIYRACTNMQGIMVKGRILLAPYHFFVDHDGELTQEGEPIRIEACGAIFNDVFSRKRFVRLAEDAALFEMLPSMRTFADISMHFAKDQDLMSKPRVQAMLVSRRKDLVYAIDVKARHIDEDITVHLAQKDVGKGAFHDSKTSYILRRNHGWQYPAQTTFGDCGSPLIAMDPAFPRKIIGMHVTGSFGMNSGTSIFVSQEMIAEGLSKLGTTVVGSDPRGEYDEEELQGVRIRPVGNFTMYGKLNRRLYQSTKTKIAPSIIHAKIFNPSTAPSVLDPRDPRMASPESPIKKGIEKYGSTNVVLDEQLVEQVGRHITSLFSRWEDHMPKEVVSEEIAINGSSLWQFCDPIPMDTSAGYPYNQWAKAQKGKLDLFSGNPPSRRVENEVLRKNIDERWEMACGGKRISSLWLDCLKDERRPIEKIIAGKTRVFTIPPVDFTIVFRRLFLGFNTTFYKNCLQFFSGVGMDPESHHWTQLWRRHAEVGTQGFAGDYSSWDGNLAPQLMMEVCEIVNRWYGDEDQFQTARRVLFDEIIHTPQACLDLVYSTHIGNPSGNPMTAIMNTILGAMYLRYCWLELAPSHMMSLSKFEACVRDTIYGDDNLITVSGEAQSFFNPDALSEALAEVGMTYTAASKDGGVKWQPLEELTFLKRGFKKGQFGKWLPLMSRQTIQELTNWIRKSDFADDEELTLDNCNEALKFAFFYGKKFFSDLLHDIERVAPQFSGQLHDFTFYWRWFYENEVRGLPRREEITQSNVFKTTENNMGIISLSQRSEARDDGAVAANPKGQRLYAAAVSDPQWSLPDMSNRTVWTNTYNWTTSQVFQANIVSLNAPWDFLVNYLQTAPFERFLYWNGSMTVHIQVNGSKFHCGRLIAYFVPWTQDNIATSWHGKHMAAAWSVPNVQIDASSSNTGALEIAYYNPKSALVLNGPKNADIDLIGSFHLAVLSQLQASSGTATTLSVTLWVTFGLDNKFNIPVHSGAALTAFSAEHHKQRLRLAREEFPQGNTITTNINNENYGKIDSMTIPTDITGDSIGNGNDVSASGLPMDKPARAFQPIPTYRKGFQNLAHTVGSEMVTRLDLDPSNLNLSIAEMYGTEEDEMAMGRMLQRPTYAGSFTWQASDAVGTMLQSRFIGPMSTFFMNGDEVQVPMTENTEFYPPILDYIPQYFKYWKGSIKLRIDIMATQMHTGRLFFATNYGAPPESETSLRDATSQYGTIMDLNDVCHTYEFKFAYNVPTPWLEVCRGPRQTDVESPVDWFLRYFLGSWSVRVLNVLVSPDNVSASVNAFWSIAGGDDFQVYYPSPTNETFLSSYVDSVAIEEQTQGDVAGDSVEVPTVVSSIGEQGITVAPPATRRQEEHNHFGAKASVRHVASVIKRYTPYTFVDHIRFVKPGFRGLPDIGDDTYGFTKNVTGTGTAPAQPASYLFFMIIQAKPFSAYNPTDFEAHMTAFQTGGRHALPFFGSMYRFWRGSLRYKAIWDEMYDYKGGSLSLGTTGAVYLPGKHNGVTGQLNWAGIALRYANSMDAQNGAGGQYISINNTDVTSLAMDVTTAEARYNDIEVPFTTIYNVLPTPFSLTSGYASKETTDVGSVMFLARYHYSGITADMEALETAGMMSSPRIYVAAGDDFRFGTFLGPPKLRCLNGTYDVGNPPSVVATPPWDTWVVSLVPAPASSIKQRPVVITTSDDDDFIIPERPTRKIGIRREEQKQGDVQLKVAQPGEAAIVQATTVSPFFNNQTNVEAMRPVVKELWKEFGHGLGVKTRFAAHNDVASINIYCGFVCLCLLPETAMLMEVLDKHQHRLAILPLRLRVQIHILIRISEWIRGERYSTVERRLNGAIDEIARIYGIRVRSSIIRDRHGVAGFGIMEFPEDLSFPNVVTPRMVLPREQAVAHSDMIAWSTLAYATHEIQWRLKNILFGYELSKNHHFAFPVQAKNPMEELKRVRQRCTCQLGAHEEVVQGNTERKKEPTNENIRHVIDALFQDWEGDIKNARMCLNELEQKIDTFKYEYRVWSADDDKLLRWYAELTTTCDNELWGKRSFTAETSPAGQGIRSKKEAMRIAAEFMMIWAEEEFGESASSEYQDALQNSEQIIKQEEVTHATVVPATETVGSPPDMVTEMLMKHRDEVHGSCMNNASFDILRNLVAVSTDLLQDLEHRGPAWEELFALGFRIGILARREDPNEHGHYWKVWITFMPRQESGGLSKVMVSHTSTYAVQGVLTKSKMEAFVGDAFSAFFERVDIVFSQSFRMSDYFTLGRILYGLELNKGEMDPSKTGLELIPM